MDGKSPNLQISKSFACATAADPEGFKKFLKPCHRGGFSPALNHHDPYHFYGRRARTRRHLPLTPAGRSLPAGTQTPGAEGPGSGGSPVRRRRPPLGTASAHPCETPSKAAGTRRRRSEAGGGASALESEPQPAEWPNQRRTPRRPPRKKRPRNPQRTHRSQACECKVPRPRSPAPAVAAAARQERRRGGCRPLPPVWARHEHCAPCF